MFFREFFSSFRPATDAKNKRKQLLDWNIQNSIVYRYSALSGERIINS